MILSKTGLYLFQPQTCFSCSFYKLVFPVLYYVRPYGHVSSTTAGVTSLHLAMQRKDALATQMRLQVMSFDILSLLVPFQNGFRAANRRDVGVEEIREFTI